MKTLLKTESVEVTQSNRGTISFSYTDKTDAMFDLFHEYCKADDNYTALQKERDELSKWKAAVIHECMMTEGNITESDPQKTVYDLIDWHRQVTLDEFPQVIRFEDGSFSGPKDVYHKAKERDEMAAYVDQLHKGIDKIWNADNESRPKWWTNLLQTMRHKPVPSLAAHDAEVVRRALNGLCDKLRYEFEGPRDLDSTEQFIDDYADSLEGK